MFTKRILDILEMRPEDIAVGMSRGDFLAGAVGRGELTNAQVEMVQQKFSHRSAFQFDRTVRSGRIVSTQAMPFSGGGFVVTFTDVTKDRRQSEKLDASVQSADDARHQLAIALELEQSRQYEACLISDFGEWLQTCKSLTELYEIVGRYLSKILPETQGELYIYSNSRDVLDGALSWGDSKIQSHIQADCCWGLRRGRNYRFDNAGISFECKHVVESDHNNLEEYTCIPIIAHGDTVGLLHIRFGEKTLISGKIKDPALFAAKCGELVSLAIANVRLRDELHEQSTRDPLTGLNNRRSCLEFLRDQVNAYSRTQETFSVISFDVDKFKSFNDNFGHDAGDAVLQAISSEMMKEVVPGQMACRFGGEEFLMVLPNTEIADGTNAAEDLRKRISGVQIQYANQLLPSVTISCGVASYLTTADNIQDLLREADLALYRAKDNGRNKVEIADSSGC
jgi:diguanylate cyclase (GGDEF)-like protein